MPLPPVSKRYCLLCEKYRIFKYDKVIGHSRCIYCSSTCAKRFSPEDRKRRYCKREGIKYVEPKKEKESKKNGKNNNRVNTKPKEKIYTKRALNNLETRRREINDKHLRKKERE